MKNLDKAIQRIEDYLQAGVFPSAEVMLCSEDDETQHFLFGQASILPEVTALKAGMHWDLASVTKVVGTGAVMIDLLLDGRIGLDYPLADYYPDFIHKDITIRQFLTHTTGLDPFIPGRDSMDAEGLIDAMCHLKLRENNDFLYSDVNFILLGLMLEKRLRLPLDEIFTAQFAKMGMNETSFGPVENAVPTWHDLPAGIVHDPKARVLGPHCGSAGLFSTVADLVKIVRYYFSDDRYLKLLKNYSGQERRRSLAWDLLEGDWLLHTGYTGTFILMHLPSKQAVIFMSNRVHLKDERAVWIEERNRLIEDFIEALA
ncbi:serine hydrolase domain-containing protein [Lactococcus termiticola]|uniref:Serine hydrolase n=1 Tax=Lactococcus termiticola TaxID=2169526 RepID=A0A2R5HJ58_9LACT|nr:serine hydrolase domain-containing protein [Lactococcus termiticola]GBG96528.1 serine hydrolase [Lactococcus termiticola]